MWLEWPPPAKASVRPASDKGQCSCGGISGQLPSGTVVSSSVEVKDTPQSWGPGAPAALTTPLLA